MNCKQCTAYEKELISTQDYMRGFIAKHDSEVASLQKTNEGLKLQISTLGVDYSNLSEKYTSTILELENAKKDNRMTKRDCEILKFNEDVNMKRIKELEQELEESKPKDFTLESLMKRVELLETNQENRYNLNQREEPALKDDRDYELNKGDPTTCLNVKRLPTPLQKSTSMNAWNSYCAKKNLKSCTDYPSLEQSTSKVHKNSELVDEKLKHFVESKNQMLAYDPVKELSQIFSDSDSNWHSEIVESELEEIYSQLGKVRDNYLEIIDENIRILLDTGNLFELKPLPEFLDPLSPKILSGIEKLLKTKKMALIDCPICNQPIENHDSYAICHGCQQPYHTECGRIFAARSLQCYTANCTKKFEVFAAIAD